MLAEIDSLSKRNEGCSATNGYLAHFFRLSPSRVRAIIQSLKDQGWISVVMVNDFKRRMTLTKKAKLPDVGNE